MEIVGDPDDPLWASPSTWVEESEFVKQNLAGELLGVTGEGHGVYVEEATTELWTRDQQWESATTYVVTRAVPVKGSHPEYDRTFSPPPGESFADATVTLDGGDDQLAEYIIELVHDHGRWKTLTARGWEALARGNVEAETTL